MTSEAKTPFDEQLFGRWLSVLRLLTVILWVLIGCVFTGLLRVFIRPFSKWHFIRVNTLWIVHPWSRGIVWILGMRIRMEGKIEPNQQIIVSHHMGLIDSLMVMALSPCMVLSNRDIRKIPFVGLLLRFLGFVFLDRRHRVVWRFEWQAALNIVEKYSGSDWAIESTAGRNKWWCSISGEALYQNLEHYTRSGGVE